MRSLCKTFSDIAKITLSIIEENDLTKDEIVATLKAWTKIDELDKLTIRYNDNLEIKEKI